jgi:hypothetical protein
MTSALENLNIARREDWGSGLSNQWPASPNWLPVPHSPEFLVVHHTAMPNDRGGAPVIRQIWQYHAVTQGWGDIRYHYLISQDGTIYEGRWRGDQPTNVFVEGGQTMTSNTGKIGIVLMGQFEASVSDPPPGQPTPQALESLVKLLGAIAYDQGLDPLGEMYHSIEGKVYRVIGGHRDHYAATRCPGSNLYTLLGEIRTQVADEVQRLRDREGEEPEEQVFSIAPIATQTAWGKPVWPNLTWGTPYLYSGAWGGALFNSLIEVKLPERIVGGEITRLELSLTGKHATYLRGTTGDWRATVLEQPLRGSSIEPVPFEALRTARPAAVFSPTLTPGDLGENQKNKLVIDDRDSLTAMNEAVRSGYLSIRLAGPKDGQRLFAWDSGMDGEGPLIKIEVEAEPQPVQDLSDLVVTDIAFEPVQAGQIRLTTLIANIGQARSGDPVEVAFLVDNHSATSGTLEPLPAGESRIVSAQQTLSLTGVHRITAIVDEINSLPEQEKQNNTLTEYIDFGVLLPDVIVLDVQLGQAHLTEGDMVTFQVVVKNIGIVLTDDVVGVGLWVDGQYITYATCSPLAPGAVQSIKSVSSWQAMAGGHTLLAIVDDVNRFPEQSEENNRFELEFQVS